jgi:hypothetical protein
MKIEKLPESDLITLKYLLSKYLNDNTPQDKTIRDNQEVIINLLENTFNGIHNDIKFNGGDVYFKTYPTIEQIHNQNRLDSFGSVCTELQPNGFYLDKRCNSYEVLTDNAVISLDYDFDNLVWIETYRDIYSDESDSTLYKDFKEPFEKFKEYCQDYCFLYINGRGFDYDEEHEIFTLIKRESDN